MDEVRLNVAYRWFLGYTLQEETPHFSTVSYNFRYRFTAETVDRVFAWMLSEVANAGYVDKSGYVIIDTGYKPGRVVTLLRPAMWIRLDT